LKNGQSGNSKSTRETYSSSSCFPQERQKSENILGLGGASRDQSSLLNSKQCDPMKSLAVTSLPYPPDLHLRFPDLIRLGTPLSSPAVSAASSHIPPPISSSGVKTHLTQQDNQRTLVLFTIKSTYAGKIHLLLQFIYLTFSHTHTFAFRLSTTGPFQLTPHTHASHRRRPRRLHNDPRDA
jgi:hypothetical protein